MATHVLPQSGANRWLHGWNMLPPRTTTLPSRGVQRALVQKGLHRHLRTWENSFSRKASLVANATKWPTPMYAMRKNRRESRLGRRGFEALAGLAASPPAAAPAPLPAAFTALLLPLPLGWKVALNRGPEADAKPGPAAATDTCRASSREAGTAKCCAGPKGIGGQRAQVAVTLTTCCNRCKPAVRLHELCCPVVETWVTPW